ncbi:hypothetical protein DL546_007360 [Coniochaeta pulveracea]|uniref:t-SNARE coiled-coil homology domain-containing protein n=1 Tax=Coniochaeta pulveracea TaxID=177199 RepID=A0A420Y981_9PEZI|nr:hypothetical protein DL546_007360 [Coniochaeta pulveracea]
MSYGNPYASAPNAEAGYGRGQEQHEMQNYAQPYAQESNPYAQETTPYSQDGSSPYAQAGNPYAQDNTNTNGQQQSYGAPAGGYQAYGGGAQKNDFYTKVSESRNRIDQLREDLDQMDSKMNKAVVSTEPARDQQEVHQAVERFRLTCASIRAQLQELKNEADADARSGNNGKSRQITPLWNAFQEKHRAFLDRERKYRNDISEAMVRQYQIVNQDATPEEARRAVEETDFNRQGGLFQQALMNDRTGQARTVLGNVQARHNEIQKIEQQMQELALLFQDLDTLVVQQHEPIAQAERQTEQTNDNITAGVKEVDRANEHARRRRRNKWICFGIVVLICIIIAVGVGVGVTATRK